MVTSLSVGGERMPVANTAKLPVTAATGPTTSGPRASVVLGIAAAAAIGVVVAAPGPTGTRSIDTVLLVLATITAVWLSSGAPWWSGVIVAAIAAAIAPTPVLVAVAVGALLVGLTAGTSRPPWPWAPALVAALVVQVFARLGTVHSFGVSSASGVASMTALGLCGLPARTRRQRRWIVAAVVGLFVIALAGAGGFGLAARSARPALEDGNRQAKQGISQLAKGDIAAARQSFQQAATTFAQADSDMSSPLSQVARVVPVLAQNRNAVADLTSGASDTTATIATVLGNIDLDSLRVVQGRIDIAAIRALRQPLQQLNVALDALDADVTASNSRWLAAPLRRRLISLSGDIDKQKVRGANALAAVQQAPALLGEGGQRVYFIAFTTPAEARGAGGFMGNFAELTITDGKLEMTRFGRTGELNAAGTGATVTGPPDWLARYGRLGFTNQTGGIAGNTAWSNITVSPDFPATAQVIGELYPQSGGRHVDGVISVDAEGIAGLMELSGPVTIAGLDHELNSKNAADFILRDQYVTTADANRPDLLDEIARTTVQQLLGGTIPGPVTIGRVLGPLASQGRITMWTDQPAEQQMLHGIGMLGELPALDGGDGLAVTVNNAAPNKIDVYTGREISYNATQNPSTGAVSAELKVVLTNSAPSQGLPDLVIGNAFGLPAGTNRMYFSVFTPLQMTAVSVDSVASGMESSHEGQWHVYSQIVEVPAGGRRTIALKLSGNLPVGAAYTFTARPQPLVLPENWTIDVLDPSGKPIVAFHGPLTGRRTLSAAKQD